MVKITEAEYAEKWGRKLKGATQDIKRGIERTTINPMDKLVQSKEKMLQRFQTSMGDGTFEAGCRRVSLGQWQALAINKGLGRISAGVDGAGDKMVSFARDFFPHLEAGQRIVAAMPNVTLDDGINRATAMMRHNYGFKRPATR